MRLALKDPMLVFVRVKGPFGTVRELRAIMDFNSTYCVMFSRDGVNLGYVEAAIPPKDWQKTHPEKVPYVYDLRGIERTVLVKLPEVSLGDLVAKDVDAIVLENDFPRILPAELILGRSFLDNFKVTFDARKGYVSLAAPASKS